ncbi:chp_TIGR02217: family protein [compost metagenome]
MKCALDVDFTRQTDDVVDRIIDLNRRAGGRYRGFRAYHPLDFSTNNYRGVPTAFDQPLSLISAGVYQLMRWYGNPADLECSRRRIRKPQANSVLIGVGGQVLPDAQWDVDSATGLVTLAANKTRSVTGITQASQAVISVGAGHPFVVGDSVVPTGVLGMTQINGLRALVTAVTSTTITVAINSTTFSAYTSAGTVNTRPQSGEAVTGGCRFDIPMRFNADLSGTFTSYNLVGVTGIGLVEDLNPD